MMRRACGKFPRSCLPRVGGLYLAPPPDRLLVEGDTIEVGALRFEVIHTPGHSPGGICLRYKKNDLYRRHAFCRVDRPHRSQGRSWPALKASIEDKLFILSDDIHLYPGHGPKNDHRARTQVQHLFVKLSPAQMDEIMFGIKAKEKSKESEGE
jgi:glyoxylase-like metal-dependent hydrolase (beta-lactamase superfamily II)